MFILNKIMKIKNLLFVFYPVTYPFYPINNNKFVNNNK